MPAVSVVLKDIWTDVEAYSSDYYRIAFYGDEVAGIVVVGDGDTDLDVYVYDETGHLVASDTDPTDDCVVRWYPRWTGVFRVEVRNLGGVYNHYYLRTN